MTPEAPKFPALPTAAKAKVFIEGAVWAIGAALIPVAYVIWQDISDNEFTDWRKAYRLAAVTAGTALVGYWRKYQAWLTTPPTAEEPKP